MKNLLKTIGPGILCASTAIGVSHLVQSTQAGAYFGFDMLWAVILANLFNNLSSNLVHVMPMRLAKVLFQVIEN